MQLCFTLNWNNANDARGCDPITRILLRIEKKYIENRLSKISDDFVLLFNKLHVASSVSSNVFFPVDTIDISLFP